MNRKNIELNKEYLLDLGSMAPVKLKTKYYNENGVVCEYLNSWFGRKEEIGYELFKMNGYDYCKPIVENRNILSDMSKPSTPNLLLYDEEDSNSIVMRIKDIEYIRVNEKGFFWKGKLIENDNDIYNNFKEFLGVVNGQEY